MDPVVTKKICDIVSKERFKTSYEDRVCYSFDASRTATLPVGVVFPKTAVEISHIMQVANANHIPVYPRGAGSGITGGSVPCENGIVLSMDHFDKILSINEKDLYAVVEPGVITGDLQKQVEERGLFYPPDPASLGYSSIGGNIAENAGGMRAVKYGVTKDYVLGLEIVLPNGDTIHTGTACVKDVVGYNLTQLFVGSEGTLGIITKALLKLIAKPEAKATLSASFSTMVDAAQTVSQIIREKITPTALEFMDHYSIKSVQTHTNVKFHPLAQSFLLIEIDGFRNTFEHKLQKIKDICISNHCLETQVAYEKKNQEKLWAARRALSPSLQSIGKVRMSEDIVVPRSKIPVAVEKMEKLAKKLDIVIVNFGHAGDGNIHVNIISDSRDKVLAGVNEVFKLSVELGGRISGEHGIGLMKKDWLHLNLDPPTIRAMERVKSIFDPNQILNPGKIFNTDLKI